MITVKKTLESEKRTTKLVNAVNEELLTTGQVKAKKQSYLPWIAVIITAVVAGIWLWKNGNQDNGNISG